MNAFIFSFQANIMINGEGRPCLSDVGLNVGLSKVINSGTWPVPSGWMFKAPEELSFECEPASFIHTPGMDVYSFGVTAYTVSLCAPCRYNAVLKHHPRDICRYSLPSFRCPPNQ